VSKPIDITTALQNIQDENESLVAITLLNQTGYELTSTELFAIIDAQVAFDFKLSITNVNFGTYRGTPWMLFTISDKNTALGGMLDWEKSLYQDLASVLANGKKLSRNRFSDSIISTTNVRILKNNEGAEELIYGFTGQNTLLITTNTTSFLNLMEKIK
jgi:hypothetical protein